MRTVSLSSCLLGLSLALGGCANEANDDGVEAPADVATEEPSIGAEEPGPIGIMGMIPMPSKGRLYASTNVFDTCAWTIDGAAFGTSQVIDVSLLAGTHDVSCKRSLDGYVASNTVTIVADKTTTATFPMPTINGDIVAFAVGGKCTFHLNGVPKAVGTSVKLSVAPGAYSVGCKPTSGAPIITRSLIVKPAASPMAYFDLR